MKSRTKQASILALLTMLTVGVLALAVILAILPFALWQFKLYTPLNVWVVDKTVPSPDFREHAGFFWILKNFKISKPGSKQLYDERSDYFGFYPRNDKEWATSSLPTSGPKPDLIYLADTYGVYRNDLLADADKSAFSPMIYGALTDEDISAIRKNLGNGNVLVAEFNTTSSPTNARDRKVLGDLLGLSWKGWIGRYFEDLAPDKEVPVWVVQNYERQTKQKWEFFGRGYVLISENDKIQILTEKDDIGKTGLKFSYEPAWLERFPDVGAISCRHWFEWTVESPGTEVVARYDFDVTESGKAKLDALGLPTRFPAIVRYKNPQYTGWYFVGDFADLSQKYPLFRVAGMTTLKKMLVDDTVDSNEFFYWRAYVPLIKYILESVAKTKAEAAAAPGGIVAPTVDVKAEGSGFFLKAPGGEWRPMFIRGVNMGLATPGSYFTTFPEDMETYLRWMDGIADMNANSIRVYTLPPPAFYKALSVHNSQHPDRLLYLFQEIWPEEHPHNEDYLAKDYRESFLKEIDYGVDAVYGRANVPERKGRAWGVYSADVSRWLLGWLVGRELESAEVLSTNSRNEGAAYKGVYVSASPEANPTEVWLAESLDTVAQIEAARYGKLHPVAIVSWPTLDPEEHDSEWDPVTGKKNKWNDRASVDIAHFDLEPGMVAGLFGAYHIYPNYPDFINNEPTYSEYRDEQGVLQYGGYLQEFMTGHHKFPALVAEFGLANGAGVAHFAPDGNNHGGLSETQAGEGILRMLAAIRREGYAGGLVFEWMDEWVKKTWTTEPFMIPYERNVFWHNVVDPEQNYGLMANKVLDDPTPPPSYAGADAIHKMTLVADAAYLKVAIEFSRDVDFAREELLVGLDTFSRSLGNSRWPVGGLPTGSGLEFVIRVSSADKADILVIPSYNAVRFRYATTKVSDGKFERMIQLVNGKAVTKSGKVIPEIDFDASVLRKGDFDEAGNLWRIDSRRLELRIPWTRINVTDPSSLRILQDSRTDYYNPTTDSLGTATTDGFVAEALLWNKKENRVVGSARMNPAEPFLWRGWEVPPAYEEVYKKSYYILQKAWAVERESELAEAAASAK